MTTHHPAPQQPGERAQAGLEASGIGYTLTEHGPVNSLEEAAAARGLLPRDLVKTLVVRISEGNYVFVLVGGDRTISWPKFRKHMGLSRIHMPDAQEAYEATGYVRGTITPFGATHPWPVIIDQALVGRMVSIGAGEHGKAATVLTDDMAHALNADIADVTELND
ncbi:aminoacyl-tRNA deacylase [Timonella sp. A28]|uniref:aminoacyl-tRNA deacylase n=1 Tax=Timonella sp. A28 TaxID=3442640 RepID=UPI003EB7EDA3